MSCDEDEHRYSCEIYFIWFFLFKIAFDPVDAQGTSSSVKRRDTENSTETVAYTGKLPCIADPFTLSSFMKF